MSSQDRLLAADGTAYTYVEMVQWCDAHTGQMWVTSEARTHNHTPQSSEFQDCCSVAAATEHSESFSIAADVLPALEPQPAATRSCSTQADFVQMHDVRSRDCRDATEHSALGNTTETQGSSSGSNEPRTTVKTICVNDLPRAATEHSPMEDAYSRWVALQFSMATDERWQENNTESLAGLSEMQPEDVCASALSFMDRIWARSKFTDNVSAELADIALVQCWSEDVLASPLRFMDRIWARSNGADLVVRDGLALLILREVQTSTDPIAFKKILDRAEFFVSSEQEVLFRARVRNAFYKVCLRLGLPAFKSTTAIRTEKCWRGKTRPKRGKCAPLVIEYS
jgi:hypothetical protein